MLQLIVSADRAAMALCRGDSPTDYLDRTAESDTFGRDSAAPKAKLAPNATDSHKLWMAEVIEL
jgi:hypothetical protein